MKVQKIKDIRETSPKKQKRKTRFLRVLRFIKALLVIGLLTATLVYTALSPFFNINKIVVKGAVHYENHILASASGIRIGENGFRQMFRNPLKFYLLRMGFAERAILELCPYVKSVSARYIIPSTVSIEVKERVAAAVLSMNGTNLLIDREGYLLEINPKEERPDLPVFKGIKPVSFKPGKKIDADEDLLLSAFKVFDTIKNIDDGSVYKLLPSVDFIDVGDVYNIRFSLQSRVLVNLGELKDLQYKINSVQTIFARNIKKNERGKLDFSYGENPVFTPENGG